MFHHFVFIIIYPFLKLFFRATIDGKDRVPKKGPLIIAANHASYLDPIMAGFSVFPRSPNYIAKKDLSKIPLFNLLISALGAFPVEMGKPSKSTIQRAISVIKRGGTLIVFPQGTRKKELNEAFDGASYFSLKTKTLVLPIAIIGTDRILPRGKIIPRLSKITVKIGKPLFAEGLDLNKNNLRNLTNQIMGQIMEMMEKEGGKGNKGQ